MNSIALMENRYGLWEARGVFKDNGCELTIVSDESPASALGRLLILEQEHRKKLDDDAREADEIAERVAVIEALKLLVENGAKPDPCERAAFWVRIFGADSAPLAQADWARCERIARQAKDMMGGYSGERLDAFHHGMDTVGNIFAELEEQQVPPICSANMTHEVIQLKERIRELELAESLKETECLAVNGLMADVCDAAFKNGLRSEMHGYDGIVERIKEIFGRPGSEAEDLRREIRLAIKNRRESIHGEYMGLTLESILDRVDARDSLAYLQAQDKPNEDLRRVVVDAAVAWDQSYCDGIGCKLTVRQSLSAAVKALNKKAPADVSEVGSTGAQLGGASTAEAADEQS